MTVLPSGTKVELIGVGVVQLTCADGDVHVMPIRRYMLMRRMVRRVEKLENMAEQIEGN